MCRQWSLRPSSVGNICNEPPIGLSKPREDGVYDVITSKSTSWEILQCASRRCDVGNATADNVTVLFDTQLQRSGANGVLTCLRTSSYARNGMNDDDVMICEHSSIKSKYKLGVVDAIHPSDDVCVRSVTVRYSNTQKNNGRSTIVCVKRCVQRLVLIQSSIGFLGLGMNILSLSFYSHLLILPLVNI